MGTSGAHKPTKRARKVLKDLQFIKDNYVTYTIGHHEAEWKTALQRFQHIEDFIIELSAGKRVLEAELAEKIKSDDTDDT
jgi:hypothetical protein